MKTLESWSTFRLVGVLAVLVGASWTILYWALTLVTSDGSERVQTWRADVQFVFAGANQGQYPNGMSFSASDLIAPVVVERALATIEGLPADVDAETIAAKLSVSAHFPAANELRREYRQRLGNNLSLTEVRELEAAFNRDFERRVRDRARLFLTTTRTDLPIVAILAALPSAWEAYMREEYRVFSSDRFLYGPQAVSGEMLANTGPLLGLLVIRAQFSLLQDNLTLLQSEPGSGSIRDPQSGLRLADIRARATQFEELLLDHQATQILETDLDVNPDASRRFLAARIDQQNRRLELVRAQSRAVDQALNQYSEDHGLAETFEGGALVMGDDFLNRLIALGVEGGDLEFRQQLTRQRLALDLRAASLGSEIERTRSLVELLGEPSGNAQRAPSAAAGSAGGSIETLAGVVRELFAATENIAAQMDALRFGEDGSMFNLGSLPTEPEWQSPRFSAGHWHWYLLGLLAALLTAGLLGLAFEMRQRLRHQTGQ